MKTAFQKHISLLLAFLMVFSMFTITASADGGFDFNAGLQYDATATATLSTDASPAEGYEIGNIFDVTLSIGGGKMNGLQFKINFDATALKLVGFVIPGDDVVYPDGVDYTTMEDGAKVVLSKTLFGLPEATITDGVISVAWANTLSQNLATAKDVLIAKFEVIKETGAASEITVTDFLAGVYVNSETGVPSNSGSPALYKNNTTTNASVTLAAAPATPTPEPTPDPTDTPVPTAGISLTASAASANVTAGEQNTVNVVMSGNTGVATMQFELTYNSNVLSVASVTPGLGGKGAMDINTDTAGKISIAWINATDITATDPEDYTGNDAVITVVFDTVAAGTSDLAITDKGAYSADEAKVTVTPVVVDFTVAAAATPTPAPTLVNLLKISEETTSNIVSGAFVGAMGGDLNSSFGSWTWDAIAENYPHLVSIESEGALYGNKMFKVTTNGDTSNGPPSILIFQEMADIGVEAGKTYTFFAKVRGEDFTATALGGYFSLLAAYTNESNGNVDLASDAATWRGATVVDGAFDWTVVKATFTLPADLGDKVYLKLSLPGCSVNGTTVYFDAVGLVEGEYDHATIASTVIPALFGEPNPESTPTPTTAPDPTDTPIPTATPTATPEPTPAVGAVEGIVISATSAELDLGEAMYISAAVLPTNAANQAINWYVSDTSVVSVVVSDYGLVITGAKAGTAIVTAESVDGGFTASCTVVVNNIKYNDNLVTEGTISVTPNGGEIVVGQSIDLDATISPAMKGVPLFYSNNVDVAYVDVTSGVLTAVAPGTAVITVVWSDTLVRTVAVFTVVETATPVTPAPTLNGEPSDWAKNEIIEALGVGLVPEHINGNYTKDITRSQFCDIIINLIEKKSGKAIADVIAGYEDAVAAIAFTDTNNPNVTAASQLGIVNGRATAGIFDPDANITRQEAAKMLAMAAKVLGADIKAEPVQFADADSIYEWAKEFVYYVNSIGVMNGTSTGENPNFSPLRTYSIEQSILTILRLFKANI